MADKTLGDRLQVLMKTLRYKQYEFADRYGISYSTIIRYKQNDRRPDSDFLSQLSRDGVNANWLLTGEGEMFLEEAAFVFGSRLRQKTLELIHPWKAKLMQQEQVNTRVIVLPIEGQIPGEHPSNRTRIRHQQYVEIPRVYLQGAPNNHMVFVVNGRAWNRISRMGISSLCVPNTTGSLSRVRSAPCEPRMGSPEESGVRAEEETRYTATI
jgi:transcriptional regulator with XRE-family HTH domain